MSRLVDLRDNKGASVLGELLVWLNSLNDVRDEFWFSEGVGGSVEEYEQGNNMMSYRFWKSKICHSTFFLRNDSTRRRVEAVRAQIIDYAVLAQNENKNQLLNT